MGGVTHFGVKKMRENRQRRWRKKREKKKKTIKVKKTTPLQFPQIGSEKCTGGWSLAEIDGDCMKKETIDE